MTAIKLTVNRKPVELDRPLSVREAIRHFGYDGRKRAPAVWINGQSVRERDFDSRMLAADDEVKFIRIFGGG